MEIGQRVLENCTGFNFEGELQVVVNRPASSSEE
jgi:hypothetical protein